MPDSDDKGKIKKPRSHEEEALLKDKVPVMSVPVLSKEHIEKLEAFRKQVLLSGTTYQGPIAVNVIGSWHYSAGQDYPLDYPNPPLTNEGGAWVGNSMFIAPRPGLYLFAVSFVKDTHYPEKPEDGPHGTSDDISIRLAKINHN